MRCDMFVGGGLVPRAGSAWLETVKLWQELGDVREMRIAGPQTGADTNERANFRQ